MWRAESAGNGIGDHFVHEITITTVDTNSIDYYYYYYYHQI